MYVVSAKLEEKNWVCGPGVEDDKYEDDVSCGGRRWHYGGFFVNLSAVFSKDGRNTGYSLLISCQSWKPAMCPIVGQHRTEGKHKLLSDDLQNRDQHPPGSTELKSARRRSQQAEDRPGD